MIAIDTAVPKIRNLRPLNSAVPRILNIYVNLAALNVQYYRFYRNQ